MLKYLLVFIAIYLVVRLFQSYTRQNPSEQEKYRNQNSGRKEGEVTVESFKNLQQDKKVSKTDGEYINYEEL
jgi:hypothetical protein